MVNEIRGPTLEGEMDLYFQERMGKPLPDEKQEVGDRGVYLNALPWENIPNSYNDYRKLN